jgi:hypothetical protein
VRSSIAARAGAARLLGIMVIASLLSGLLPSRANAKRRRTNYIARSAKQLSAKQLEGVATGVLRLR